jgi:hypothetical protein
MASGAFLTQRHRRTRGPGNAFLFQKRRTRRMQSWRNQFGIRPDERWCTRGGAGEVPQFPVTMRCSAGDGTVPGGPWQPSELVAGLCVKKEQSGFMLCVR